ncbi:hypothetical protein BKA62DRAFT_726279 [Auriculariales sp. MPI-PUGE-AT-0066]|nr:hypothetical protein BKA62DRAFT_726279 [Auriculariales sp. MPI-PUGE-AT-0066]
MLFLLLFALPFLPLVALPYMFPSLRPVWNFVSSQVATTYNYITDAEVERGDKYTVLRHTRPFVIYQGVRTTVPITILGETPLPSDRRVFLQRRGYRTALFGWSVGGMLGGSHMPGIEVTPVTDQPISSISSSIMKDIARICPHLNPLQTLSIHIPVASGDGYFRFRVTKADGRTALATSPVFRVGSISLSSAHPQGATLIGLAPEFVLRSVSLGATTAGYAAFYAAFPFLKLAQWTPGPWKTYAARALYTHALNPEQQQAIENNVARGRQSVDDARATAVKRIPFGAVGVRTDADIAKDDELGRAGVCYNHSDLAATATRKAGVGCTLTR